MLMDIAINSILAAMLLPVLSKTKKNAIPLVRPKVHDESKRWSRFWCGGLSGH